MLVCGGARFPCWNRRACAGHRVEIPPDEADGDEEGDEWNDPRWSAEHLDGYTAAFHRIDGCGEVFETVVRIIAREASGAGVVNVVSSASTYGGASRTQLRVKAALEAAEARGFPEWLSVDYKAGKGVFKAYPQRAELPATLNEGLVVELYSR